MVDRGNLSTASPEPDFPAGSAAAAEHSTSAPATRSASAAPDRSCHHHLLLWPDRQLSTRVRSPSSVRDAIPAPAELSGTPSTSVRCVPTVAAVLRTRNFPRTLRPARQSCRGTTSDHGIGPRPQPTRLDCRGNLAVSPGTHSTPGRGLSSSPPRRSRSSRLTSRGWSARRITPSADRRICSIRSHIRGMRQNVLAEPSGTQVVDSLRDVALHVDQPQVPTASCWFPPEVFGNQVGLGTLSTIHNVLPQIGQKHAVTANT